MAAETRTQGTEVQKQKKINMGDMQSCLLKAKHHLDSGVTWNMMKFARIERRDEEQILEYRNRITREELQEVLDRIERIRVIAEGQDFQDVLDILKEEFEFGHDVD